MASSVETVQASENVTTESKPSLWTPPAAVHTEEGESKKAETSTPQEPAQESEEAVWSTIATSSQITQATEKEIPDSTEPVADAASTSASGDVKKVEANEAVSSGQNAPTATVSDEVKKIETKETVPSSQDAASTSASADVTKVEAKEAVPSASTIASGDAKKVETDEVVPSSQDALTTVAPTVTPSTKTEEVKVEEVSVSEVVSKIVSGVAEDIDNVQDGLAKEVASAAGEEDPSLLQTIEGGLVVVEKEVVKGVVETVQAVESHPELIAEGVLAAAVGAASFVQPELLPGAIAIVGKMASDSMKKTVVKIATDEGKKIGAAIGKDISDAAAKEKAAKAAKEGAGGAKENGLAKEGASDVKIAPIEAAKDAPKTETPSALTNGHENTEHPAEEKLTKPEISGAPATEESSKSTKHEGTSAEAAPSAPKGVEESSSKVEVKSESEPKPTPTTVEAKEVPIPTPEQSSASQQESKPPIVASASISKTTTTTKTTNGEPAQGVIKAVEEAAKPIPTPEKAKEAPIPTPEQPSPSQQESKPLVLAAAASITKTTVTTKTTNEEPVTSPEKPMANISQESLDQLHQKIDTLHLAIKQITETLALHLPPPTPAVESSKQKIVEVVTSEPDAAAPSDTPSVPSVEPSKVATTEAPAETVAPTTEQPPPKRPTVEKRSSVLGSIGKIFWPFGSSSPTKSALEGGEVTTADSSAPKVPTVTVTEVPQTPEIEI